MARETVWVCDRCGEKTDGGPKGLELSIETQAAAERLWLEGAKAGWFRTTPLAFCPLCTERALSIAQELEQRRAEERIRGSGRLLPGERLSSLLWPEWPGNPNIQVPWYAEWEARARSKEDEGVTVIALTGGTTAQEARRVEEWWQTATMHPSQVDGAHPGSFFAPDCRFTAPDGVVERKAAADTAARADGSWKDWNGRWRAADGTMLPEEG
jgi:hypothetical protein